MPHQVDQASDGNGAQLAHLSTLYEFPEFVKAATVEAVLGDRDVPPHAYADPGRRLFACDSKAATWVAALCFAEKAAAYHPNERRLIADNITAFARFYGIEGDVEALREKHAAAASVRDADLPDSSYAYVWTDDAGRRQRSLRIKTAAEVSAAAEWLHTHHDRLPLSDRCVVAGRVLEKAASLGASVGPYMEYLERQAGRGFCDPAQVVEQIEKRASIIPPDSGVEVSVDANGVQTRTEGLRAAFLKMASTFKSAPRHSLQPDMLRKLAHTLDRLDGDIDARRFYGKGLMRPEDVVFSVTLSKSAGVMADVVATTSGSVYEKSALAGLRVDVLGDLMGDDFVQRVTRMDGRIDPEKMAEEVAALPRPDAEQLDGIMADHGFDPVTKRASAPPRMTDEERRQWADIYNSLPPEK